MELRERKTVRVACADAAEATREAASLRQHLLDADLGDVSIDIVKEDQNTQDTGATLVLLLGAPAAVAVARGIADWLRARRAGSEIEITIGGNRIKAAGAIADDPARLEGLVAALRSKK
jgi:membrane-associated two-gene conflict system component 1 (EACC1)